MTDAERLQESKRDIPKLRELSISALKLSNKITKESPYKDEFGRMGLLFLSKQREHMDAILLLADHQKGRDVGLIIRSMLEGMAQLLWASEDPKKRGALWSDFSHVIRWRRMREYQGIIDPKIRAEIEENLAKYGTPFLTPEGKQKQQQGQSPASCHYRKHWMENENRQIKRDLIEKRLDEYHARMYEQLSTWHHWSLAGFSDNEAVLWKGVDIEYQPPTPMSSAIFLNTGFQCLLYSTDVVNKYLELGFDAELGELRRTYQETLSLEKIVQ